MYIYIIVVHIYIYSRYDVGHSYPKNSPDFTFFCEAFWGRTLAPSYLFSIMSMKMVSNKAICKPKFLGKAWEQMGIVGWFAVYGDYGFIFIRWSFVCHPTMKLRNC